MTASTASPADEDRRAAILAAGITRLWELAGDDVVRPEDAAPFVDLLDRLDEKDGVVRVNLARQRAIDEDRSRLRAALHAVLQAFESAGPPVEGPNGKATRSIWIPQSMVEGWRLIAEGGA